METKILASVIGTAQYARRFVGIMLILITLILLFFPSWQSILYFSFNGWKRPIMVLLGIIFAFITIDYYGKGV